MTSVLEQIQRGIDFLEERLHEDLDLKAVSRAAGMSHAHFQRCFKALTQETLGGYVRARRMARALDLLLHSRYRILDISMETGFESQEAFARAFRRSFGMSPSAFRKLGEQHRFLKKVRLDASYLAHLRTQALEPRIIQQDELLLVGYRTRFYGRESEKNNLGQVLPGLWDRYMPRASEVAHVAGELFYGVVDTDPDDAERLVYHACRPVVRVDRLPEGMHATRVTAGTYAVFEHRGRATDIDQTVNYIYGNWLTVASYHLGSGPDLEFYGDLWHPTSETSVMHYAVPVVPA